MKSIQVTDEMYDRLVELSIEQDEYFEVMTCAYLEIGIRETHRADGSIEFYKLTKKFPHLVGHC